MALKSIRDLKIVNNIRVELIRRKIDFTKLRLMCENGYVTIIGKLDFVDNLNPPSQKIVQELEVLDKNLRRLAYIKFVKYFFENWQRDDEGKWHQITDESAVSKITYWVENISVKMNDQIFREKFLADSKEVNRLLSLLKHEDSEIRRIAVKAVLATGEKRFFSHIIEIYTQETEEPILIELILAVGKLGGEDAIHLLKKHLEDKNMEIVLSTIKALSLAESRSAVPVLLPLLSSKSPELKAETAAALARLGKEEVLDSIDELAKSSNMNMRLMAVDALSRMKPSIASERLAVLLNDSMADVRFRSAAILSRMSGKAYLPKFLEMLVNDKSEYVRATLVKACADIGKGEVLDNILPLLKDKDSRVRANTIEALDMIISRENRQKVIENVLPMIEDENNRVRVNAINLLSKVGETSFTDKLFHMLKSPDPQLFSSASFALAANPDIMIIKRLFDEIMVAPTPVKPVIFDTLKKIEQKLPEEVRKHLSVVRKEIRDVSYFLAKF